MAENTAIEWTDHTFNHVIGCSKVHKGCANCYAERDMDKRRGRVAWGPNGTRSKTGEDYWQKPLKKWNDTCLCICPDCGVMTPNRIGLIPEGREWPECCLQCGRMGVEYRRPRVFCASLADVFEDWQGPIRNASGKVLSNRGDVAENADMHNGELLTMSDLRRDLFALIDATPNLDWLLLTKRPENIRKMWDYSRKLKTTRVSQNEGDNIDVFRPNVWIGTSISDQESADKQIPELLKCRDLSPVLFLSAEPLLGAIDCRGFLGNDVLETPKKKRHQFTIEGIDWVIAGGESGPNARPMHPQWARSLRDQCAAACVPFLFKQWGEWSPEHNNGKETGGCVVTTGGDYFCEYEAAEHGVAGCDMHRVGKKAAGRLLDGKEYNGFPEPVSQ